MYSGGSRLTDRVELTDRTDRAEEIDGAGEIVQDRTGQTKGSGITEGF